MYSSYTLALKYLRYYIAASNGKGHGVHSPFVFDFIKKIKNQKVPLNIYGDIEKMRQRLLGDARLIEVEDFGAGSAIVNDRHRKISRMAASSLKPAKFSKLMYRIIHFYKPRFILELGTSFGITTAYMAKGNPAAKIITIEGAPEVAHIARENLKSLGIENVTVRDGSFDAELPGALMEMPLIDLAFIDGHHLKKPTLAYFEGLLPHIGENSILIFDDIHWSAGMEEAWAEIKGNEHVRLSIDLFFIGLVFFRSGFKHKQHFSIRF